MSMRTGLYDVLESPHAPLRSKIIIQALFFVNLHFKDLQKSLFCTSGTQVLFLYIAFRITKKRHFRSL